MARGKLSTVERLRRWIRAHSKVAISVEHIKRPGNSQDAWRLSDGIKTVEVRSYAEGCVAVGEWLTNHPTTGRYSIIVTVTAVRMIDADKPIDLFAGPEVLAVSQSILPGGTDQSQLERIVRELNNGAHSAYAQLFSDGHPT